MFLTKKETCEIFKDSPAVTDSYNEIANRLINRLQNSKNRIITFTSSVSGEGCTETVLGVASAFVNAGKRVLIIDANECNPALHTKLEIKNETGFSNLLSEGNALKDYIQKLNRNLEVMTFGTKGETYLETFNSEKFEETVKGIAEKYSYVIIDAQPISKMSESFAALCRLSNLLLVARMNLVTTKDIKKSLTFAKEFGFQIMSVVLNGTEK